MKIAYLTNIYPAISHTFIRREIEAVEATGIDIERFTIRRNSGELVDERDKHERERTTCVLETPAPLFVTTVIATALFRPLAFCRALKLTLRVGRRSDRGLILNLIYLAEACVLRRALRECLHLHAHFATNSATVAMLCHELGGPPFSFTAHGTEEIDKATILGLGEKIARARFVVTVSSFGRSQMFRRCDAEHWPKIHVVRTGLGRDMLDREPTEVPKAKRLVCVGRLCGEKGQLLLVDAVKRLIDEGNNVELVLVGDGEMRARIETAIERHSLGDQCTVTGWVDNDQVIEHIQSARVVVLPSFSEGLPVVVIEAFALHRPVVCTWVAGIPELVEPGVNGWLVPAGSIGDLTEALRQALDAPDEQLNRMASHGLTKVRQQHAAFNEAAVLAKLLTSRLPASGRESTPAIDAQQATG